MNEDEIVRGIAELGTLRRQIDDITFTDTDKETFRVELIAITDKLLVVNAPTDYSPFTIEDFASYIMVCRDWLRQLIESNAYRLNEEMSYCIMKTIEKWDWQQAQRIVIFTVGDFAVHKIRRNVNTHRIDSLLTLTRNTGVTLTKEPVFIRVPDQFKEHILTNIPLFHEIGHFFDMDNSISERVLSEILPILQSKKSLRLKRDFFPYCEGVDIQTVPNVNMLLLSHIEEYIADIFGAQYSGEHILCYASFLETQKPKELSKDHPLLTCRKRLVDSFLYYCHHGTSTNILLDAILKFIPSLSVLTCSFSEEDLLSPDLRFTDFDHLLSSLLKPWCYILREAKRNRIRRDGAASYMKTVGLPVFNSFDSNIRRAVNEFMNR